MLVHEQTMVPVPCGIVVGFQVSPVTVNGLGGGGPAGWLMLILIGAGWTSCGVTFVSVQNCFVALAVPVIDNKSWVKDGSTEAMFSEFPGP